MQMSFIRFIPEVIWVIFFPPVSAGFQPQRTFPCKRIFHLAQGNYYVIRPPNSCLMAALRLLIICEVKLNKLQSEE